MDQLDAQLAGIKPPPIPEDGLTEVLSKWIGRGELFDCLAAPSDLGAEPSWSAFDLELRSHRVLIEQMKPTIRKLPTRIGAWLDAIPATRVHRAVLSNAPTSGTSWTETRIRYGWPPSAFATRHSERTTDTLLATALRWTLGRMDVIRRNSVRAFPDADLSVRSQLDTTARLLAIEPLASVPAIRPTPHDLMGLRRSGAPWGTISELAELLRLLDAEPMRFVSDLIAPDNEVRWRLFHLSILGILLTNLSKYGCLISSLRPLGGGAVGPAFIISHIDGREWQLWFEAAGIWSSASIRPPYAEATAGLALKERAIGADILLIGSNGPALIIECKYSNNRERVAREGYYQASAYSNELASRFAKDSISFVVGPEGVIMHASYTRLQSGYVGVCPPKALGEIVCEFLNTGSVPAWAESTQSESGA